MEPTTTTAAGFAISKIYYALAGLFGGFGLSFFWQPAKLKGHSRAAAGAIIGGVSVGASVIFGGALAVFFGLDPHDANVALSVGGGIGIFALAVLSLVANFFDKREGKDILEVAQEITSITAQPKKPAPRKKPVARKTVARKVAK